MLHLALLALVLPALCCQRLSAAEGGRQEDDGRIVFTAQDGQIIGTTDLVSWEYKPTRWGMYDVSLTYTNAGSAGSEVEVTFGAAKVVGRLATTGGPDHDAALAMGRLYVADTKPQSLVVRCARHAEGAAIHLREVTLTPACEGKPPTQTDDGVVTLHGRDATVQGTVLRYEPAEKKQTLGYWTRPTDAAVWSFTLTQAGMFDVEVLQGCGPGQGGSVMTVAVDAGQPAVHKPLDFTVDATGGFQDFRERVVGRVGPLAAGQHTLRIVPKQIAKQAACDIRQIRLVPVTSKP